MFWHAHRRVVRASGGRKGLWIPRPGKWGALRLTTTGRRSGQPRSVILGYYEDGPDLVSMAMNGWGAAEPAWWLNLQADPQAVVELAGGIRRVTSGMYVDGSVSARNLRLPGHCEDRVMSVFDRVVVGVDGTDFG
jgi:F420H(2)-dependent quinone reductase